MKYSWKLIRRIAYLVALVIILVAFKVGGVFIDVFLLIFYGMTLGGIWAWKHIYLGGLDRIAKKNADAIVKAQEDAARKKGEK